MRPRASRAIPALLLAAAVLTAGCAEMTKGKGDAERAVAEFHAQFNQGRFEGIWDAAGDGLKTGISQQEFSALLAAVRRKLGDVTGSSTRSWNVSSRYVVLVQDTTFATGRGSETFRFAVKDGRATLVGYDISSRELILR